MTSASGIEKSNAGRARGEETASRDSIMGGTALIIGGGFAGMLAARVLADFFGRVIVCEKDTLANDAYPRRGVPQGSHIHGPLLGTIQILTELFPGLPAALTACGAFTVNAGMGIRTFVGGRWLPQRDFDLSFPMQTRGLLEHAIRQQISLIPNVLTRTGSRVLGLSNRGERITGVVVRSNDGADETIDGDLVIDASGRGSRLRQWLASLGYGEPHVSRINVDIRYVSCLVKIPPGYPDAHMGLRIRDGSRTGVSLPVEGGQWIISLSGRFGDYPPTEVAGFVRYAETLNAELGQRLKSGEAGKLTSYHFPSSLHWHYEAIPRFPHRLLPIGDAVMCLNPVYGQGMAAAAFQAKILATELAVSRTLDLGLNGLTVKVLPRYADVLEYPWRTVAVGDFELDQTSGDRPAGLDESARFARALAELVDADAEVHRVSLRVQQLLDPPEILVRSGISARVLARLAS
jgi:2-polyprenyl-6-methoxyphenol hydroxylase-like FAD-dependent oxidoreductase